jgi:hypothetical protein
LIAAFVCAILSRRMSGALLCALLLGSVLAGLMARLRCAAIVL